MKVVDELFDSCTFYCVVEDVLTLESVDEILRCDYSDKELSSSASRFIYFYSFKVIQTIESVDA